MRSKILIGTLVVLAYLAGLFTTVSTPTLSAQRQPSRFVKVGDDGPFVMWRDTRTDQCFIVTTPYFAMLSVGQC